MKLSEFDYALPAERIAQRPAERRDASRLLVLPRRAGAPQHRRFAELEQLLGTGDLLVLNDTRVIPARLHGRKQPSGGRVELLLDRPLDEAEWGPAGWAQTWTALVRASKPLRSGGTVELGAGARADYLGRTAEGSARLRLVIDPSALGCAPERALARLLERRGQVPLPAYIRRSGPDDSRAGEDRQRYQTVYAARDGAVAAPTAGLHFTPALLERLAARGVELCRVTLHVGPGTFLPVRGEDVAAHRMHPERYHIDAAAAEQLRNARAAGRRLVAVGTTVVRTLEAAWDEARGGPRPGSGLTDLFIRPGYRFQAVDALLTNFHLPRSTLLMLVCAFAGRDRVLAAYRQAVERGYRFYSYGDAMLLA
jgi:S-adenosylmethionine:tRNA ribosyltransferase-isomerase